LEPEVQRVHEEEKAEREIAALENQTNRLQNRLEGKEDEKEQRMWFKDRAAKAQEDKITSRRQQKKLQERQAIEKLVNFQDEEDKKAYFEGKPT